MASENEFPQRLKPICKGSDQGTAEAVPLQSERSTMVERFGASFRGLVLS
jgi:hypothetical protein